MSHRVKEFSDNEQQESLYEDSTCLLTLYAQTRKSAGSRKTRRSKIPL